MIRTTLAFLGAACLATSASAADYKVSTVDKSPSEVRVAIEDAANKACRETYAGDALFIFERDACVRDVTQDALAKIGMGETAKNAPRHAVVASR